MKVKGSFISTRDEILKIKWKEKLFQAKSRLNSGVHQKVTNSLKKLCLVNTITPSHNKLKDDSKTYQWSQKKINYALLHFRAINSDGILKYYCNFVSIFDTKQ